MDIEKALSGKSFRNDEAAVRYYFQRASKGDAYSQYVMGLLTEEGKGIA